MSFHNGYEITCHEADNGSISLTPAGGAGSYMVTWTGPDGFTSNNEHITNLSPGNYEAVISDENGCEITEQYSISEPEALSLQVIETINVLCFGEATGSITILVEGGIADTYTYEWTRNGLPISANSPKIDGLLAGEYSVKVIDANDCQISQPSNRD